MDISCFIAYFISCVTCFVISVLLKKDYYVYFEIIFCFNNDATELENCFVVVFVAIKVN